MYLQQTVTEPNEAFQKQFDCGQFPVVDVVVGLPGCHSPQQLVKCTQLQGEPVPLMCWSNTDADLKEKILNICARVHSKPQEARSNSFTVKMYDLSLQARPVS